MHFFFKFFYIFSAKYITEKYFKLQKNAEGSSKILTLVEKFKSGLSEMKFLDSAIALALKYLKKKSRNLSMLGKVAYCGSNFKSF